MKTEIKLKISNFEELQKAKYKLQEIEESLEQADHDKIFKEFDEKYKDQWIRYYNKDDNRYSIMKVRKLISINSSKTVNGYLLELLIEEYSLFNYIPDDKRSAKTKELIASIFTYEPTVTRSFVYSDCIEVISRDDVMQTMWNLTGHMSQWLQNAHLAKEVRDHFDKKKRKV